MLAMTLVTLATHYSKNKTNMKKWYLYQYTWNDNVDDWEIRRHVEDQTATCRSMGGRNFTEVTDEEKKHLTPTFTGTYEMCVYYLDYILHERGLEDTFTFVNK